MMATGDQEIDDPVDVADTRQREPPPVPWSRLILAQLARLPAWQFTALMVALAVLIALIATLVLGHSHYELLIESGATTVISAINLIVGASLAWLIFQQRKRQEVPDNKAGGFDPRSQISFWALLAAGLLFLALDELLYIHERIDWLIHSLLDMEESDLSDSLDDVIVVIYLGLGLACLYHYRTELRLFADLKLPVAVGLGLAVMMVLLDLLTSQRPGLWNIDEVWWMTGEELCKLAAQWVLLGVLWRVQGLVDDPL